MLYPDGHGAVGGSRRETEEEERERCKKYQPGNFFKWDVFRLALDEFRKSEFI